MSFKPYCEQCLTWHADQEGHRVSVWCDIDNAECFSLDCLAHGCMWTSTESATTATPDEQERK